MSAHDPENRPATQPRSPKQRTAQGAMHGSRTTHRDDLLAEVDAAVRRLAVESQKLGHAFAGRHGLHATDFEALVHIMDAEGRGAPLTPGALSAELGLSSGATTGVIDRLERAGHVYRARDEADRRKIYLRYAERGATLAVEFFGGLRASRDRVMAQFTDADLVTIQRYLTETTGILAEHRRSVADDDDRRGPGRSG